MNQRREGRLTYKSPTYMVRWQPTIFSLYTVLWGELKMTTNSLVGISPLNTHRQEVTSVWPIHIWKNCSSLSLNKKNTHSFSSTQ